MNINIYKSLEECNSRLAEYLIEDYLTKNKNIAISGGCLLYTSDAADE